MKIVLTLLLILTGLVCFSYINNDLTNMINYPNEAPVTGVVADISSIYSKAYDYYVEVVDQNDIKTIFYINYYSLTDKTSIANGYYYSDKYNSSIVLSVNTTLIEISGAWTCVNVNGTKYTGSAAIKSFRVKYKL